MLYLRRKSYSVKELKEELEDIMQELEFMDEDEIVSGKLDFETTKSIINQIVYDREGYSEKEGDEETLRKNLEFVPPHVIHMYDIIAEEEARESDDYWTRYEEGKNIAFDDEISKFFPKKEKSNEEDSV